MQKTKKKQAFTLVELMIVIAIIVMIASVSGAVYTNMIQKTYLDTVAEEMVANLRLAQMRSISNFNQDTWGLHFNDQTTDSFTLFKGASYAARETSWDIETPLPPNTEYSILTLTGGGDDIIFTQVNGQTTQNGTIQIQNNQNQTKTINVNQMGQIELN